MSTIQDKQDLAVTVTPSPQDAPVSSEAPQTAAGTGPLLPRLPVQGLNRHPAWTRRRPHP